jgi:mono/diheme cytochrome c family protein
MMSFRNPILLAICMVLAVNLVRRPPGKSAVPHGRRPQATSVTPWASAPDEATDRAEAGGNAALGQVVYASNCTSCHGSRGHGLPRQGANLRTSKFIAGRSDAQLLAFLREGRRAGDPASVMGLMMPARGGNRALDDGALSDIVAFLRSVQDEERQEQLTTVAQSPDDTLVPTTRPALANIGQP